MPVSVKDGCALQEMAGWTYRPRRCRAQAVRGWKPLPRTIPFPPAAGWP